MARTRNCICSCLNYNCKMSTLWIILNSNSSFFYFTWTVTVSYLQKRLQTYLLYFIHAAPNVTFLTTLKFPWQRLQQQSPLPVGKWHRLEETRDSRSDETAAVLLHPLDFHFWLTLWNSVAHVFCLECTMHRHCAHPSSFFTLFCCQTVILIYINIIDAIQTGSTLIVTNQCF